MVTPFIFSAGRQVYAVFLLVVGQHHRQPRFDEEVAVRFPYQVRFRPGAFRMAFLYHCYPVLPVFFRRVKDGLLPVLTQSPRIFSSLSAFVSLQEVTNANATVTADSSRIKFNRFIMISFLMMICTTSRLYV